MNNMTTYTLKQSVLNYEKKKKPRDLLGELSHYKALSHALIFYAVSSTATLIILAIIYS